MSFTQDDMLQIIRDAMAELPATDGEAGITTQELIAATGQNPHKVRKDLVRLIRAGVMEAVKVRRVSELTGYNVVVPGFRPK